MDCEAARVTSASEAILSGCYPSSNTFTSMVHDMTVLLASNDVDLLRATKFALECRGFTVMLVMREMDIANHLSADIDIIALDIRLSQNGTGKKVEHIRSDPRCAGTALILFSRSRAELQEACSDRSVLNEADDILVEMFDESDLIDRITSAAKRLRLEKSQYHRDGSEWKDPYAANSPEERRKDKRFRLDAPATIRGRDVFGELFEEETLMLDVSAGGAYLKSEYHLEENTRLEISVRSPHTVGDSFDVRGTIVRTEQGNDKQEFKRKRVAVKFSDEVKQSMEFHLLLATLSGGT